MRTFLTVFVRTRPCVPDKNHASFVSLSSSFTSPSRLRSCLRSGVHALVRVRTMLACFACERGVTRRARRGPRDGGRRTHSFGPMEIYFLFFFLGGKSVQRYRIVAHTTTCIIISQYSRTSSRETSPNDAPLLWAGEAEPSRAEPR